MLPTVTGDFTGARMLNLPQSVLEKACRLADVEPGVFAVEVGVGFLKLEVEVSWGESLLLLLGVGAELVRFLFLLKLE